MGIFSVSTCDSGTRSMAGHKALRIILLRVHEHLASVTDVIGVDQAFGVVKCRIASLWQRAPGSLLIKNQR